MLIMEEQEKLTEKWAKTEKYFHQILKVTMKFMGFHIYEKILKTKIIGKSYSGAYPHQHAFPS